MPRFVRRSSLRLPKGVLAVLNLEAGCTRASGSLPARVSPAGNNGGIERIKRAGSKLVRGKRRPAPVTPAVRGAEAVEASRTVWIFGSGRSGSTWLRSMMAELPGHRVWEEPMVGALFGDFYARAQAGQLKSRNFILGEPNRDSWISSIRSFVLEGARRARPDLGPGEFLVVKEPNGSSGAPLIMEALPEARMVLLVRDPRDVVASSVDAAKEGSWLYEHKDSGAWKEKSLADKRPDVFVRRRAERYVQHVGGAKAAYEAHRGPKALVRYEELRADALGAMRRLYADLGMEAEAREEEDGGGPLPRAVAAHAWESIPESERGEGKFYRKATPGGWREDLTPEQAASVEEIAGPLLRAFYPGG